MGYHLGDLGLREAIVHPDWNMADELRHLAVGDQGTDRDQAAVARGEIGTQPQVAEKDISRVLHDARKQCAKLIPNALGAVSFGGLVQRQQRGRSRRQLVRRNVALGKHVFRHRKAAIAFAQPE